MAPGSEHPPAAAPDAAQQQHQQERIDWLFRQQQAPTRASADLRRFVEAYRTEAAE